MSRIFERYIVSRSAEEAQSRVEYARGYGQYRGAVMEREADRMLAFLEYVSVVKDEFIRLAYEQIGGMPVSEIEAFLGAFYQKIERDWFMQGHSPLLCAGSLAPLMFRGGASVH